MQHFFNHCEYENPAESPAGKLAVAMGNGDRIGRRSRFSEMPEGMRAIADECSVLQEAKERKPEGGGV